MNNIRKAPKNYVKYIDEYINDFEDGCLYIPDSDVGIELEEGIKVLEEARKFLNDHPGRLKELKYNELLRKAGVDHYVDIATNGIASHKSSDGKKNYKDRIEKYAAWGGAIFEAILYGP